MTQHPKDLERMQLNIDAATAQHMTGEPMHGWEVPLHVGIDPVAPEGDRTVACAMERGEMRAFLIHKSRSVGPSTQVLGSIERRNGKPVPMLNKQVGTILANHGRPRPPTMPKTLDIIIRPSYPWFHSCGYAVGRARLQLPPRPMRIVALAVQCLLAAPTLTHQA